MCSDVGISFGWVVRCTCLVKLVEDVKQAPLFGDKSLLSPCSNLLALIKIKASSSTIPLFLLLWLSLSLAFLSLSVSLSL